MANLESHPLQPGDAVPILITAGVFKQPEQLEPFMQIDDRLTVPTLTLGSFTMSEWLGNAKPGELDFVYYTDLLMAGNAKGLPNPGKEGIKALKEPIRILKDLGVKTIISVTNLPKEAPIDVIPDLVEIAAESNPTAVEVNLSCPNGLKPDGTLYPPLCNDVDASSEVMAAARAAVGVEVCLGAKDSPHVLSPEEKVDENIIRALAHSIVPYIDFLTGINTIPNQSFPEITCANGRGGMSGPVVADVAKQHLKAWLESAPDLAMLSCGGVDSSNARMEIRQRLSMGAMLVGGTQEFYRANEPYVVAENWAKAYIANT